MSFLRASLKLVEKSKENNAAETEMESIIPSENDEILGKVITS